MKYKITYLANSDYCELKPSDKECHRTTVIDANSKAEAVMQLHREMGMVFSPGKKSGEVSKKNLPVIWSVEKSVA